MQNALVTGGSRGVGEATAVALAERGFDIALTCREKQARAAKVVGKITELGRNAIAVTGDMTIDTERASLARQVRNWHPTLDALVLNASGGLESSLLAERPDYPVQINHDAQVGLVNEMLPALKAGSTIAFITSHWAHLHGTVEQLPNYEPVAASKRMGETALRNMQPEFDENGIRLLVVTGDLIDGTITAKLLERSQPGLADSRRNDEGELVTAQAMGIAIAEAIMDPGLPSGHTVVVGAMLDTML
jgi:NAD(P)-dependent dehydrogenase (short-subunit alcohol dehydrogenase family)